MRPDSIGRGKGLPALIWTVLRIYTKLVVFPSFVAANFSHMTKLWQRDRKVNNTNFRRRFGKPRKPSRGAGQRALIRVASRDSLRATVFLCSTPLVVARCIS